LQIAALALPLLLATSGIAAEEPLFGIDPYEVEAIGVAAILDRYPELSPADLRLQLPGHVFCESSQPVDDFQVLEQGYRLAEEEFTSCVAKIRFDPSLADLQFSHVDSDGRCRQLLKPWAAIVEIHEDGNKQVTVSPGKGSQSQEIECTREFLDRNSFQTAAVSGHQIPFSVDPDRILDLAIDAATTNLPEVRADELGLGFPVGVHCVPNQRPDGIPVQVLEYSGCFAHVDLVVRPGLVLENEVDENGKCWTSMAFKNINVEIDEEGNAKVNARMGPSIRGREVECSAEFYEMLEQIGSG